MHDESSFKSQNANFAFSLRFLLLFFVSFIALSCRNSFGALLFLFLHIFFGFFCTAASSFRHSFSVVLLFFYHLSLTNGNFVCHLIRSREQKQLYGDSSLCMRCVDDNNKNESKVSLRSFRLETDSWKRTKRFLILHTLHFVPNDGDEKKQRTQRKQQKNREITGETSLRKKLRTVEILSYFIGRL